MSLKRKPSTSPNKDCVTKVELHMDDSMFQKKYIQNVARTQVEV
jgi:hypothetical protein